MQSTGNKTKHRKSRFKFPQITSSMTSCRSGRGRESMHHPFIHAAVRWGRGRGPLRGRIGLPPLLHDAYRQAIVLLLARCSEAAQLMPDDTATACRPETRYAKPSADWSSARGEVTKGVRKVGYVCQTTQTRSGSKTCGRVAREIAAATTISHPQLGFQSLLCTRQCRAFTTTLGCAKTRAKQMHLRNPAARREHQDEPPRPIYCFSFCRTSFACGCRIH